MRFITRRLDTDRFIYYDGDEKITDKVVIERVNKLAIPPAWTRVEIARSASAKVQARGHDAAGRPQYIYHTAFRERQEKAKFDRMLGFAKALPKLRRRIDRDLRRKRLTKEKVLACVVKLIDTQFFRVGNEQYAREHGSYGITTLRSKHADITTTAVTFDFMGKSGKHHVKTIKDRQLAHIIKQLDEMPGYEIFRYLDSEGTLHDIHSSDVNAYIKQYMGEDYTAKDFRTWGGTLLATSAVLKAELEASSNATAKKRAMSVVVRSVAKRLGNTPAVARASYIDPRVFAAFEDERSLQKVKKAMQHMRPKRYMSVEEQCVLKVLSTD